MKLNNEKSLVRAVAATLVLSCTVAGIGILTPVFAEDKTLPAPPAISDAPRDRGPEDGGPRGPRGPRRGEGPYRDGGPRGPRGMGPRGERPDEDGPGGPRAGGPRPEGPEGRGPRDEDRRGHREDGPNGLDGGPRNGGPRDFLEGGPERGPRREGPEGPGRFNESGPRGEGPRERNGRGPGRGEGPESRERDGRGPGRDGGPEGRGPRGERGDELQRAAHDQADLKLFGNLTGDAYNISGQSRDYYNRALNAQKAGNEEQATQYSRTSGHLARAAISLAELNKGKKLHELRGDQLPFERGPKGKNNDMDFDKERASHDLNRAYRELSDSNKGQWNETARRLYTEASSDFKANRFDAASSRARVAAELARAGADL